MSSERGLPVKIRKIYLPAVSAVKNHMLFPQEGDFAQVLSPFTSTLKQNGRNIRPFYALVRMIKISSLKDTKHKEHKTRSFYLIDGQERLIEWTSITCTPVCTSHKDGQLISTVEKFKNQNIQRTVE